MRFILSAILALFISGCASQKNEEIAALINKKEIKVGLEANFKPLVFKEENQIKGIEPDLAAQLEKITGTKVRICEYQWNDLIPALEAGKIDVIMSGMTITPERARIVDFTAPYIRAGQMALIRNPDISEFSTIEKITTTEKKIGYILGTTGDYFVAAKCTKALKFPFNETDEGIKALSDRKIDIFIIDAPVVWEMSGPSFTSLLTPLTEEHLGWAVRKNDKAMLDGLNKCLEQMKKDGTLDTIKQKWIPQLLLN
ncbi:MAG TPA: hypothetical protein DCZ94_19145 [Lentisphaeria bacterium]|nr:MAG: hypothetical protein A2X48_08945 [Lentisphaerae bacterium GWF2_49_21]HBC89061.1 hypothetical protein [Lentisphaeria bacterium]